MSHSDFIEDGFGNRWRRYELPDCDLAIVRPGKAQCTNCDVGSLRAEREMLREPLKGASRRRSGRPQAWTGLGRNQPLERPCGASRRARRSRVLP